MFKKILIANRGEIACRVIKTARKMGIKTVAVYSDADKSALHVKMADEAVHIGEAPAAQSYLVAEKIIKAAKDTGAEAIHPGYGFLSENPNFAKALAKNKITFIGPNVKAIEVMGDKIESKKFAIDAGVNTVPGNLSVIKSAKDAIKIAGEIGYPVMIKASAGGGGKGMRIARSKDEVEEGFNASKSEAKSSFGDDRIFIEKFIEQPRHIEIQLLADKHGNIIYLAERECSIQRRNQKVLEEAPSSFLDEKTRKAMGEQSVALAKAVNYESAGTVEFIVDQDRNFYFLEMNTRLQVEHPVTELITGIDLVEEMIRVANNEKLKLKQKDVNITGWAIESRIYAEDPYRNFLPSTGRLQSYKPPVEETKDGLTIRNDTGVHEGGEISIYYDPMIAKLITHGPDRKAAITHMASALDEFYIDGIQHNIPFLSAIMQHKRWVSGDIATSFIEEEYPDGFKQRPPNNSETKILTAVAAAIDFVGNQRRRSITGQMHGQEINFAEKRIVKIDDSCHSLHIISQDQRSNTLNIIFHDKEGVDQAPLSVESNWWFGMPLWKGMVGDKWVAMEARPIPNGYKLSYNGVSVKTLVLTEKEAELLKLMPEKVPSDTSKLLLCPMPGLVVAIHVNEGDQIQAGQSLCIVEAMKMENTLRAEKDTIVTKINVSTGDSLPVDTVIMEFD